VTRILINDEAVRRAWRETTTINRTPVQQPPAESIDPQNEGLIRQLVAALFGDGRRSTEPGGGGPR
jgi:hypothetical protein